ncbi:hypothetical protein BJ878DRAFT_268992 [Calycina marina]|uniref:DUF2470 domain-containing protein n=1 Tax=Calycina marina TaxID=1763456 RepID=A0A9P7YVK7_9HELO|nr:hypothetical protein BJ878DRAFT_268992 [Calycina marina]
MADEGASKNAAAKARIIKHLNADHQKSLTYYLQHYNSLSSFEARSAQLTDITFDAMTFSISWGNTSTVPIYPPMKSWSEARVRTVEMDRESRKALGISPVSITEYEPPKNIFHVTIFALCVLAVVVFATKQWIAPGTFVYDKILPFWPGGPEWFLWISNAIALPVVGIHVAETVYLDYAKLYKYGVVRGSALWFKWIASSMIEGRGAYDRIMATAQKKELEDEKQKH